MPRTSLLAWGFAMMGGTLTLLAIGGVHWGLRACGDPPEVARRLALRFEVAAAIWITIAMVAAETGLLRAWDLTPPPLMPLVISIVVLGIVLARSSIGDRLARGVPLWALVGFQAFRLPLELLMHRAYTEGVMPVQMSYSGRNFDIITGITAAALGLALFVRPLPRWFVLAWNILGLALLTNIVVVAILSTPVFRYFGPDHVNTFVAYPPFVLLPAVMVLAAWAGHLIIFRALRHQRGSGL